MYRVAWTDDRLDDLAARMDAGFGRVHGDTLELRGEVSAMRSDLARETATLRSEFTQELRSLRSDLTQENASLRSDLTQENASLRSDLTQATAGLRSDLAQETASLRGEIDALRVTLVRAGVGIAVGLVGVDRRDGPRRLTARRRTRRTGV